MADPTTLELIQLCLMLVSVVVYVWFLATIIHFRKVHPFNSSFFTLSLALGFSDLQCLFSSWVLGKFSTFGWLYMDSLARRFNGGLAKIQLLLSIPGVNQQILAVAIMACNRCTALAYFNKHELIWTRRFLAGVVGFQIVVPVALTWPIVITQDQFYPVHNVTGEIGLVTWVNKDFLVITVMATFINLWLVNALSTVLYSITFWKVKKSINTTRPQPERTNTTNSDNRSLEVRLGLVGLCLSVLLAIYGWILFKLATVGLDPDMYAVYYAAWTVTNDIFSWCNPWLCLMMSPIVREHMFAMFERKRPNANNKSGQRSRRTRPTKQDDRVIELGDVK